jgi:pimeloyl-ACP methyl ester carboxylesterase
MIPQVHAPTYSEFYVSDEHPVYVQRWRPTKDDPLLSSTHRVVLIHGGVHTGVCWTARPDGRPGWAQYLAEQGWTAYVVDWPGVGRSAGTRTLLQSTAAHIVTALAALVREIGPTLIIGHSFGAAIGVKVMDIAPKHVTGLISIAPAPHGNIAGNRPPLPGDQAINFNEDAMRRFFCNAPRFPKDSIDQYRHSLCLMSPGVFNAAASTNGSRDLVIDDFAGIASIPKLVVAGDNDQLVTDQMSSTVADSLNARHVTVGKDWGLFGFGHMIPIETGSEEILKRCLDWFADARRGVGSDSQSIS